MVKDSTINSSPVWEQFQQEARKRRRDPVRLLTEYMRECLEVWQDQKLDEEIQREAQNSGYREADAVTIVRHHRQKKREQRAAS